MQSLCVFVRVFNLWLLLNRGFVEGNGNLSPGDDERWLQWRLLAPKHNSTFGRVGWLTRTCWSWQSGKAVCHLVGWSSSISHMLPSLSKEQHWWHGRRKPCCSPHGLQCLFAALQQHEEGEWDLWNFETFETFSYFIQIFYATHDFFIK